MADAGSVVAWAGGDGVRLILTVGCPGAGAHGLLSPSAAELSMDLAAAYPPEAGIISWHRTIRLDRAGTDDSKILIDDSWEIDHSPERVVVHLISASEPRPAASGRLLLATGQGTDLAVDYPAADFGTDIGERQVDDPRLASTWGPFVYRITLAARRPAAQGGIHLEIRASRSDALLSGTASKVKTENMACRRR